MLLLASSSLYRRELLLRLQLPFITHSPNIDETPHPNETWEDLVTRLSIEKAKAGGRVYPDAVCIGSDEVAVVNNTLLGKPEDHTHAQAQLSQMSGQKVYFYTGICVWVPTQSYESSRVIITAVQFRTLTDSMIENYLHKEKPYQSAGSFKFESLGCALIHSFEGEDPTALIGLPLIALCDMLAQVGIEII